MSKKLLTAAVAALSMVACDETSTTPVTSHSRPTPIVASTVERKDGGVPKAVEPVVQAPVEASADTLAIAHDTPGVDHLARARQLKGDGDLKGSLTESRRALYSSPVDAEALELTARTARRLGQHDLAAEAFGRLGTIRKDDAVPLIMQARSLLDSKDAAGALIVGREAVSRDPGNAEGHHVVGLAQLAMNELKGAITSFQKTLELTPDNAWAMNNLGFAYLRANENEKAVQVLNVASEKLPTVAYVHNNLGVALERVGKKDEARAAYLHAMDLSPRYVKARINAARVARVEVPDERDPDGGDEVEPQSTPTEPSTLSDLPHPRPE